MIEYKEYTYEEWKNLSLNFRRKIINQYWNPYLPEKGKETRQNIVEGFLLENPRLFKSFAVGIWWFGFYVVAIFVIVEDSKIRVPRKFCDIPVNKGILMERRSRTDWIVRWRDIGGKDAHFDPEIAKKVLSFEMNNE